MTSIKLDKQNNKYRRYFLYVNDRICGKIVVEKYSNLWNLELLNIIVFKRKGYARLLIDHVFEELNISMITVCPVTKESLNLFSKYYRYKLGYIFK